MTNPIRQALKALEFRFHSGMAFDTNRQGDDWPKKLEDAHTRLAKFAPLIEAYINLGLKLQSEGKIQTVLDAENHILCSLGSEFVFFGEELLEAGWNNEKTNEHTPSLTALDKPLKREKGGG